MRRVLRSLFVLLLLLAPLSLFPQQFGDEKEETSPLQQTLEGLDLPRSAEEAFLKIPRRYFLPDSLAAFADEDQSIPLAYGSIVPGYTMSARLLKELALTRESSLLVYGRACGFFSAVAATMAEKVDVVELRQDHAGRYEEIWGNLGLHNVSLIARPAANATEHAPYTAILIHGSTETVPASILDLLRDEGRLVAPLTDTTGNQLLVRIEKHSAGIDLFTVEELYFPPGDSLF